MLRSLEQLLLSHAPLCFDSKVMDIVLGSHESVDDSLQSPPAVRHCTGTQTHTPCWHPHKRRHAGWFHNLLGSNNLSTSSF